MPVRMVYTQQGLLGHLCNYLTFSVTWEFSLLAGTWSFRLWKLQWILEIFRHFKFSSFIFMSYYMCLPTRVIRICKAWAKRIEREGKFMTWPGVSIVLLLKQVKHVCYFKLLMDYQLLGTVFSRNWVTSSFAGGKQFWLRGLTIPAFLTLLDF